MARTLKSLTAGWAIVGGIGLLAIMLVTFTNVSLFLGDRIAGMFGADIAALSGYEDFVRLVIAGSALAFFPYCQLRRGHVAVDIFVEQLPRKVQRAMDRTYALLTALLALFLLYFMSLGMLETRSDQTVTAVIGWPQWPFYAPCLVSLALWAAVSLAQTLSPDALDG